MDERFASATSDELDQCGRICIICRDAMDEGKKLPRERGAGTRRIYVYGFWDEICKGFS